MLVLAMFCSGLCSGLEMGCYSVNHVRMQLRAGRTPPDWDARILRAELERPARLLATLLIANNIVNALAAEAATNVLVGSGYSSLGIAAINTLVLGPLLFVLGDAFPKELFRIDADRLTPPFSRALRLVRYILTGVGVLPLVQWFASSVERLAKLPRDSTLDARQRVASLLREGAGHGLLSEAQLSLVDRALAFRTVTVGDEMIPWAQVQILPSGAERARMLDLVGTSEHAHFPIVDRQGRVQGVIRHLDLYTQTKRSPQEMILAAPRFAPALAAREALARLRAARARIAIVEDPQGRPLGVVTAKDLVEPLTGKLRSL
jgi:CBS domain containing-hemolysin-like protein